MKSHAPARVPVPSRERGFTLLEVMIALVITAIGLLGIAKIEALAYASTGSASLRSLVALEAAGLAASMHADRNYWSLGQAAPIVITGAHITSDAAMDATAATANYCVLGSGNTPCAQDVLAAFDLHTYATALFNLFGNNPLAAPTTTINCSNATIPVSCTIQVTWNEKAVSLDAQSVNGTNQTTFAPTYTLYVEP